MKLLPPSSGRMAVRNKFLLFHPEDQAPFFLGNAITPPRYGVHVVAANRTGLDRGVTLM